MLGSETWGYSVTDLLQELGQSQTVPQGLKDVALELDKAYIPARYPNAQPTGSPRRRKREKDKTERPTSGGGQ
jgi:HEPN domain-containing protein